MGKAKRLLVLLVGVGVLAAAAYGCVTHMKKTKEADDLLNKPYAFVTTQGDEMQVLFIQKTGLRLEGELVTYTAVFDRDGSFQLEKKSDAFSGETIRKKPQNVALHLQVDGKIVNLIGDWSKNGVYLMQEKQAIEAIYEPVTQKEYLTALKTFKQAMDDMIVEWYD